MATVGHADSNYTRSPSVPKIDKVVSNVERLLIKSNTASLEVGVDGLGSVALGGKILPGYLRLILLSGFGGDVTV
ncbi:hypothetical protein ACHAPA_009821 [Fusarium lateritium]